MQFQPIKWRNLFFVCTLAVLVELVAGRTNVSASDRQQVATASGVALLTAVAADTSPYEYVGSKTCKKCHIKQYKSWEKTRMGQAFQILKPGNSKEAKEKFNVDVSKDYTKDPTCLKCHTVGFSHAGGYHVPDLSDKKAVRKAKKLEGIGCESCHGPGSEYVKVFKEIQKSKRTYRVEELYSVGLAKIGEATCKTCHNEESPTINAGDVFDYEARKAKGTHEHFPLKQRAK